MKDALLLFGFLAAHFLTGLVVGAVLANVL